MKPIKLTMQAFGSYGNKTVIDFQLPNQNLFLVTGTTGAGKTTIFDAIVFAIYGEASSNNNKKGGEELQSQFVGLDQTPYVELEFSERNGNTEETYTVRRIPRHLRSKKRGEGETVESEKVTLIMPDGIEYPQREANAKLEDIVGLSKSQFMQVAMIAQGEFMEMLRTDSNKKKEIFQKLFNTEIFSRISVELFNRKKAKEKEIAEIKTRCQTEMAYIEAPQEYKSAEELLILKDNIMNSGKLVASDMEKLLALLKDLCMQLQEQENSAKEIRQKADEIQKEKRDSFSKGETLIKNFILLQQGMDAKAECEAEKPKIDETEKVIGKIDKAYEIKGLYDRYMDGKNSLKKDQEQFKLQTEKMPGLEEALENASVAEAAAAEEKEKKQKEFTQIEERVNKSLALFKEAAEAKKTLDIKQKNKDQADLDKKNLDDRLTAIDTQERELKKEEIAELGMMHHKLLALYEKSRNEYIEKKGTYNKLELRFYDEQASYLAKELKEGQPCPVCGALEHPNPRTTQHEDMETLTREQLETMKAAVDAMQDEASENAEAASVAKSRFDLKVKDYRQKYLEEISLEEVSSDNLSTIQNRKRIKEIEILIDDCEQNRMTLKNELQHMLEVVLNAEKELEASKVLLYEKEQYGDYKCEEEANAALSAAETTKNAKVKGYEDAARHTILVKTEVDGAKTLIEKYKEEIPRKKEECERRKLAYEAIMQEKTMNEEAWNAIVEEYDKSDIAKLQQTVDQFKIKAERADATVNSAQTVIGGQQRPEMDELRVAKEEAEAAFVEADASLKKCERYYESNARVYNALEPRMDERKRIIKEHTTLEQLYNMVSGKNTGARMDLETFVQRQYLEQILYSANRRFMDMSCGQFELRMVSLEKAGAGGNHGLDLMVYSNVTGKEREVRTLSGGESFMAALSLALGMADQIQEKSLSINLDIMFIDEGFGSLDDHSRNQAVKVLQEMADGSKLIGIISHVSELKQEIEDKLIVSKDDDGSHVKWQIS